MATKQIIERATRAEYGERVKQTRERITKLITNVPSFLEKVRDNFKAYNFETFDRKLKNDLNRLVDEKRFEEAAKLCTVLRPKFSTIRCSFEKSYEDEELNMLIDEFYSLASTYFESYRNLIHKFIHDHQFSSFFNYKDIFNDSYSIVVFTLTLYDHKKAEFGTLLGKNMNHFINWLMKKKTGAKEVPIDDLPPGLLKYTHDANDLESVVDDVLKAEFIEGSNEYNVGRMMVIEDASTKRIGQTLNMDTKQVTMTKRTIVKRLTNNPKIIQIVKEIKE